LQNRLIVKSLHDFALKEYKEKRPTEILGYRVKLSVLLQRGFGPSIILRGIGGQAVPYLILANYGSQYRLYYFLENGRLLNAINIEKQEFELEEAKFQKATAKLFQIPKPSVPENKLEKLKKQLNDKFQQFLTQIEKQTSCKIKTTPIITVYQSPLETKLIIKREQNFIKMPLEIITHKLIDGFLLREAYSLIFPSFIKKTKHADLLRLVGAYYLLPKSLHTDWIQYWEPREPLKIKLSQLNEPSLNSYLRFLCYFGKYESTPFLDPQLEKYSSIFFNLLGKTESISEIAAQCYLQLANHQGFFIIKAALFFILANRLKEAKKVLKELSQFAQLKEIHDLRIQCEFLASFQISKIYSSKFLLESVSRDLQKLYSETFDYIKTQLFEVKRIHKLEYFSSEAIRVKLKIKNLSDIPFQNIKLTDELPKKSQIEKFSSNTFYFAQIRPSEETSCEYEFSCETPQKLPFKNGTLTFEDTYGNHYVQLIPITLLNVQK